VNYHHDSLLICSGGFKKCFSTFLVEFSNFNKNVEKIKKTS